MTASVEFLRQFQICQLLGISDETWRRWVRRGLAPQPVREQGMRPRWLAEEIEAFRLGWPTPERTGPVTPRRNHFGRHKQQRTA